MSSNTVDDVTKSLAETNISDNSQQKTNAGTANEADAGHAAEGKRLYVGNLAYATTEGELKAFFEGYSVCVSSSLALTLYPPHCLCLSFVKNSQNMCSLVRYVRHTLGVRTILLIAWL
jgi:RNA recognition motif-containing protein